MSNFIKRKLKVAAVGLVGLSLIAVPAIASASDDPYDLRVSLSSDRSHSMNLQGKSLHDDVFIYAVGSRKTSKVSFYVDDPRKRTTPIVENIAPYDLAGTNDANGQAKPFNTKTLSSGSHTIVAVIEQTNGRSRSIDARFSVSNTGGTPPTIPPVTTPPVTTPPVTTPPVTHPPVTTPPVTHPPVTTPPVTAPPVTSPPVTTPPSTPGSWWKPTPAQPLQLHWMLDGSLNLNNATSMGLVGLDGSTLPAPDVYDIDGEYNTKATVDALHARGKKVICYIDAGVFEDYRGDASRFPDSVKGNEDIGWEGSRWLDLRQVAILEPIMKARMQMCKDKGFDAIEPDEVIYDPENNTGFPLTYQHVLTYSKALAQWAHAINMSIGQKDNPSQAADLVNDFDWNLNEECYQYDECETLLPYIQRNKAVFVTEYNGSGELNPSPAKWAQVCVDSKANHFNTTLFKLGLPSNGGRQPCTTARTW